MKNIYKILAFAAISLFFSTNISAQNHTAFSYTMGIPLGTLNDHTSKISWRGFLFDYHREVNENITVGFKTGWSTYYERKDYASYTQGTATLSGVQYRYNNICPVAASIRYNFNMRSVVMPFVGLSTGFIYDLRNTDMGMYTIEEDNYHFLLSPEIGVNYEVSDYVNLRINAIYDYGFKIDHADGFGMLSFNFGIVFKG